MWLSSLTDLVRGTDRRCPTRGGRKHPTGRRLSLEALEERAVPAFLAPVNYGAVGTPFESLAVGDFNHDGKLDVVSATSTPSLSTVEGMGTGYGQVVVRLNNGDGTFRNGRGFGTYNSTPDAKSIVVGDFNHDGNLDVALTVHVVSGGAPSGPNVAGVIVALGDGNGSFQAPSPYAFGVPFTYNLGDTQEVSIATGDLNHDGNLDLIVAGVASDQLGDRIGHVSVLLGTPAGAFAPAGSYPLQSPPESSELPTSIAVGDFRGDGTADDVAVTSYDNSGAGRVRIFTGDGTGVLLPGQTVSLPFNADPTSVVAADFNGDHRTDLAIADPQRSQVSVLINNGDGTFQAPRDNPVSNASIVVAADFNQDGKADLATDTGVVLVNKGDGTFQAPLGVGTNGVALATGDFNGDHFPDLAFGSSRPFSGNPNLSTISVLTNDGHWAAQAASLKVGGYASPATAGTAGTFTVTALDASGKPVLGYAGTVHFTSGDAQAVLPADYTFTAADKGVHTFTATLKTAGTQSLAAADTKTAGVTGSETGIVVNPAAASKLRLGAPASAGAGTPFTATVAALDAYGNRATGYRGTVHFTSSDGRASLPGNYAFTAADAGVHDFSVTLRTAGAQSVMATDTQKTSISGSAGVSVGTGGAAAAPAPSGGTGGAAPATAPAPSGGTGGATPATGPAAVQTSGGAAVTTSATPAAAGMSASDQVFVEWSARMRADALGRAAAAVALGRRSGHAGEAPALDPLFDWLGGL